MIDMTKRTVKAGSSGRFGARYGVRVRKRVKDVERTQRAVHECPSCHHESVKREGSGIWRCRHCDTKFAALAYTPVTRKAISKVPEK
ncbi:MAG: large subunit ribosomal protein L37Ae [Candidatus Methanomethylophilaceae archaeon]|nr:large subunit ribosomal protein L37Ae [Candidatus Methanomethylophilaceae archaeon]MDI3541700.1 large subunit ribosomal protein L37Ae [Candidatus Methanomethylophilaceae archaeon]